MTLNECYSVPGHLARQIRHMDPMLRLKWDKERQLVRAERKVTRSKPLDPTLVHHIADYEMARDGYCPWLSFLPHDDNYYKLIYTMSVVDAWKLGGWRAIAETIEADEAREKEEKRRSWKSDVHLMAVEMFRNLNTPRTGWRPYEVKAE